MGNLSKEVGERLHTYRKIRGLSVEQLAQKICRSTPTVYKYESGKISLDINTIEIISKVLDIDPALFFGSPKSDISSVSKLSFFNTNHLYCYYYDGRTKKQVKSLLTFYSNITDSENNCSFYMDISDFTKPEQSRYIYSGRMKSHETVSYFLLENITLPIETLTIQMIHPFQTSNTTWGIFMGLSDKPLTPMATKILFSKEQLTTEDLTHYNLEFTKDELKNIKNQNSLLLNI